MSKIRLRPSGAARWLTCPSSLILEAQAPVIKSHDLVAAYLGTATHELLEMCVVNNCKPDKFRGDQIQVFDEETMDFPYLTVVDYRMIESVKFFLEYVIESERDVPSEHHSELRMDHSEIEGLGGTADFVRIYEDGVADLYDLKNGTAPVQAKNRQGVLNKQLLSYATLLVNQFPEIREIRAAIVSPNIKTKSKVRTTDISLVEISHFEQDAKSVVKFTEEVTPSTIDYGLTIGGHCWFCKARNLCPAKIAESVSKEFDQI